MKWLIGQCVRFRFSTRVLFLVMTGAAILAAWLGHQMKLANDQQEIVATIRAAGATVVYKSRNNALERWLGQLFGIDFISHVELVRLNDSHSVDMLLSHIKELGGLRELELRRTDLSDKGMVSIGKILSLQHLEIGSTNISDKGLTQIGAMEKLRTLDVSDTRITNEGLLFIARLPNLTDLNIESCQQISDAGIAHLVSLSMLISLDLQATRVTDAGLRYVSTFGELEVLRLADSRNITDDGMHYLAQLTNLRHLDISHLGVTNVGIEVLVDCAKICKLQLQGTSVDLTAEELAGRFPELQDVEL